MSSGELISAMSWNGQTIVVGSPSGYIFETRLHVNSVEMALDGVSQMTFEELPISEIRFGCTCTTHCLIVSAAHLYLMSNVSDPTQSL